MAQKPDIWMPLYLGAYIADTLRFTTEQHGAYFLLIMDYWRNGSPPDDDNVLSQITKLSLHKWKAHRPAICAKFQIIKGEWKHKRIEHELGRAKELQDALSERGKTAAAARWNKDSSSNASSNATSNSKALLGDAPSHSPSHIPLQAPGPSPSPSPESQKQPLSDAACASPPQQSQRGNGKGNGKEKPEPPTRETWTAYSSAYQQRYGVEPIRNKTVNSKVKQFVERIGIDEAPSVAASYISSNRGLYVSAKHPVDLLLRDAETLRTEWATHRHGTETEGRMADRTATVGNVFNKLIQESREAKKNGH